MSNIIKMKNVNNRIRVLEKAKEDFIILSRKSRYKARFYKVIDLCIKIIISLFGAIVTYFSDSSIENNELLEKNILRALGIVITVFTALSSIFTFEKRSLSNFQIYSKCENFIPEIDDRLENKNYENVKEYVKNIYKELSYLSLASFTDSISNRFIKNVE